MKTTQAKTRSDAQKNRDRIIQSAIEVFSSKGIHAKIEEIAEHANVGVGTIYRNIGSKQDLANLISYEILNNIYNEQLYILNSPFPIEEKLNQIFEVFFKITDEYGEIHDMIIHLLTSNIEPNLLKEDWLQKLQNIYHQLVIAGQKEGVFSKENTLVQEKILINTINPALVKEISSILPLKDAAVTLSKFVLNGLIIK